MPSQPVRILYVAEFSTGGSVESLLCLVAGLDKSQYAPTVLFFFMPDDRVRDRFQAAGATVDSLFPHRTERGGPKDIRKRNLQQRIKRLFGKKIERWYESFKYAIHYHRIRRPFTKAIQVKMQEIKPELVHFNNGVQSDTPGFIAARRCRVPAVCHVRTFSRVTQLNVAAARSIRKFICISEAVQETLVAFGIDSKSCVVVPNAVDPAQFKTTDSLPEDIRAGFGFDDSHFVFALIGRIVSWKGQDYFVEAIAEAHRKNDAIRGVIVGDAGESENNLKYLGSLKCLVQKHQLNDVVTFAGHRSDVPDVMKSVDVVVCGSSLPEPFGRVIIESMATGTAVIATNAGGAAEIIRDNENGLLVPIKDSVEMSNAMIRLCNDSELAAQLVAAANKTVNERYSVGEHANRVSRIYESITKRR